VRIISGKHARKFILAPTNLPVRPTTDFAKEALFNILSNRFDFEGLQVLDLCTGTGNIAYEFAARGAEQVLGVDMDTKCIRFVDRTAKELGFDSLYTLKSDVVRYLSRTEQRFDIIFADPPYDWESTSKIPGLVFERGLLNPEGWLIVEHPREISFNDHPNLIDTRKYGKVWFSMFSLIDD